MFFTFFCTNELLIYLELLFQSSCSGLLVCSVQSVPRGAKIWYWYQSFPTHQGLQRRIMNKHKLRLCKIKTIPGTNSYDQLNNYNSRPHQRLHHLHSLLPHAADDLHDADLSVFLCLVKGFVQGNEHTRPADTSTEYIHTHMYIHESFHSVECCSSLALDNQLIARGTKRVIKKVHGNR